MINPKVRTAKTAYQITIARAVLSSLALTFSGPTMAQVLAKPASPLLRKATPKPAKPKLIPQKVLKPGELLPFFDTVENPELLSFPRGIAVDPSPQPPKMTDFDRDVLKTCGAFGSAVDSEQVRSLFVKHPAVVNQVKEAVGGNVLPRKAARGRRLASPLFFEELVQVWTVQRAFEHVFCGQVKGNRITGLHFAPRYYELQQKGIAGRLPKNEREEEVVPGAVYTVGIQAKVNGRVVTDSKSGYYYGRDAMDILIDGTLAHQQFNINSGTNNVVCLYKVPQTPNEPRPYDYPSVFVKNDRGIVTLYPDVTPNPGDRACDQLEE
jgi:Bacterial EndoU nuclease